MYYFIGHLCYYVSGFRQRLTCPSNPPFDLFLSPSLRGCGSKLGTRNGALANRTKD